jgi:hypothetical protein
VTFVQLWTCHLAHWDVQHLLLNVIAVLPPVLLAPPQMRRRLVIFASSLAPLLSQFDLATSTGE